MTTRADLSVIEARVRRLTPSDAARLGRASRQADTGWGAREAARLTAEARAAHTRPNGPRLRRDIERAWQEAVQAAHPEIPAGAWSDCVPPVNGDLALALEAAYEAALGLLVADRDPATASLLAKPWRTVVAVR